MKTWFARPQKQMYGWTISGSGCADEPIVEPLSGDRFSTAKELYLLAKMIPTRARFFLGDGLVLQLMDFLKDSRLYSTGQLSTRSSGI